tara:strand:+ start:5975 stop:6898 length:924 start_codon:yes stop_codon:yes gene_type:complete
MPTLASTYQQDANATNKRDVGALVTNSSPTDSPIFSLLNSNAASGRVKESVTDVNAAANKDNALAEGGSLTTPDSYVARDIESNVMQIFTKTISVTGSQETVAKYGGVTSEISYMTKQKFIELSTDVEQAFIQGSSATGTTATGRKLSGLVEKITTNALTIALTSATWTGTSDANLALYEDLFNDLLDTMWETGQSPNTVFVGGAQKRRISKLSTKVTRNIKAEEKTQILSINMYDSDFGVVNIILDRYVPDANIIALALDKWETSYLRRFQKMELAKTNDSTQISIVGELTLDGKTEKAGGKITAL